MGTGRARTTFLAFAPLVLLACQGPRLDGLVLPSQLPPSPGNSVADDLAAAKLGHALFFDARLSSNQNVRCASCHEPERFFTDGETTSLGLERVARNSPSLLTSAWHRWQMWDGRADSLWSQPLLALENPKEMNFTRLEIAHRMKLSYRAQYEAIFGALPALDDAQRFPARGRPGDASWEGMTAVDRLEIDRVVANVGKALEAYQRKLSITRGRLDEGTLTADELDGARVFQSAKCDACHAGPLFTDDGFHALGDATERARAQALDELGKSPFTAAGEFHEGPKEVLPLATPADEGAYRTPSLRNVSRTGPWGHAGQWATLEETLPHGGVQFTAREVASLLAFLKALDAGDPPSPWNNWPNR